MGELENRADFYSGSLCIHNELNGKLSGGLAAGAKQELSLAG